MQHVVDPAGETSDTGNTYNERNSGKTLPPLGIGKCKMMLIIYGTVEQFAHNTENVYSRDDNRAACSDSECTVEEISVLE